MSSFIFRFAVKVQVPNGIDDDTRAALTRVVRLQRDLRRKRSATLDTCNFADVVRSLEDLHQTMARARASAHRRRK